MLKITAQRAAAMEAFGLGKFEVRGRAIIFTGNDSRTALWGCASTRDGEMQVASWRRVFAH